MSSLKEELKINNQDRIWFVKYWAKYMRTHSDKDWSKQQKYFIDSLIKR